MAEEGQVTIPSWEAFQYCEVWEITEMRGGCVFKTRFTGKFCKTNAVLPSNYVPVSISTTKLKGETLTMEIWNG